VLVHSLKSTGRAAVLIGCYLIKTWECPADYAINQLRVMRPVSIENKEQEAILYDYHNTVAGQFKNFYRRDTDSRGSSLKTEFLGRGELTSESYQTSYEPYRRDSSQFDETFDSNGIYYPPKTFNIDPRYVEVSDTNSSHQRITFAK
jgi:hypothetical protein